MELAYRLAVEDSPLFKQIRDNVIVSITPVADPDGRDRYVDWYYRYGINEETEQDRTGPARRTGASTSSTTTTATSTTRRSTMRELLDVLSAVASADHARPARVAAAALHLQRPGAAEPDSRSDPLRRAAVVRELRDDADDRVRHARRLDARLRRHVVARLSRLHVVEPQRHAPDVRDFGNGGANTDARATERRRGSGGRRRRTLAGGTRRGGGGAAIDRARMVPAVAAAGEFDWSMRNNTNYMETGVLTALQLPPAFPKIVLENFYLKSRNSIDAGRDGGAVRLCASRRPARHDAGRASRQPAAAAGHRGRPRHRRGQAAGRHVSRRLVHRQARSAVRPAGEDPAREAGLSRSRTSAPTTTPAGRWG